MLRNSAINGVKWTSLAATFATVVQFLQILILARFLSEKDFGLMAVALMIMGFSQLFLDMGISNAIIYKQEVSHNELSSLFWLNVMMGWFIFIVILILSPFIAVFFEKPDLQHIINLTSIAFLIQPFEQQFYTLMRKDLRFNEIARRDIFAKMVSFIVAVVLALNGVGVMTMVVAYLVSVAVSTITMIAGGLKYYRPSLHFRLSDVKPYISFGIYQMGDNTINFFNSQFDTLLVGKLLGIDLLGVYNVAKNTAMRPAQIINPIITQVSFPVMAKAQNDGALLKRIYLRTINYLCSVNFLVYVFIAALSQPVVVILFGEKWKHAAPVLMLSALYAMFRSIFNPMGSLLAAKGRIKMSFYWNVVLLILTPIILIAGVQWQLQGVVIAQLVFMLLLLLPGWKFMINAVSDISSGEYFIQILRPLIVAGVLFGLLKVLNLAGFSSIIQVFLGLVITAIWGMLGSRLFNRGFYDEVLKIANTAREKLTQMMAR